MNRFRCAFSVRDDLHDFAAWWLTDRPENTNEANFVDGANVTAIYREGRFQVERCELPAGSRIPVHVHPMADTIEVGVSGAVRLSVRGVDPFASIPDGRLAEFTRGRGIRINREDDHGGSVVSDVVFLSIQRWSGSPQSVLTNYEGERLGPEHEKW